MVYYLLNVALELISCGAWCVNAICFVRNKKTVYRYIFLSGAVFIR